MKVMKNLTIYRSKKTNMEKRELLIYILGYLNGLNLKGKVPSENIRQIGNYIHYNHLLRENKEEIIEDDNHIYYNDNYEQSLMDDYNDDLDYDQQDPNFW
jgi:hypothetical protein